MPEGVEIEIYRRAAETVVGRTIMSVEAPDPWFLKHGATAATTPRWPRGRRAQAAWRAIGHGPHRCCRAARLRLVCSHVVAHHTCVHALACRIDCATRRSTLPWHLRAVTQPRPEHPAN